MSLDLYMFAGINGAGKSSLYRSSFTNGEIKNSKRANADEIAKDNNWDWHDQSKNFKAIRIELENIFSFIETKQSFNMETTFASSRKSYLNILNKAKSQGFITHLFYVGLSSSTLAKKRVHIRVSKGGHGIPDEVVEKRYPKSLRTLEQTVSYFDTVDIYDNTDKYSLVYRRKGNTITFVNHTILWAKDVIAKEESIYS